MSKKVLKAFRNSYLAALLVLANVAQGQLKPVPGPGQIHEALKTLKALYTPYGYFNYSITGAADSGRISYFQKQLWLRNDTGWVKVGTDVDTTSLSARIDQKLDIVDTAGKWKPLAWLPEWTEVQNKPATFPPSTHTHPISQVVGLQDSLSDRYTKDQADALLAMKLNKSDTASMLTPYLRKGDTAAMLSSYLRKADTVTLSNRINTKITQADGDARYAFRTVSILPSGNGIQGGGDLTANRTFNLDFSYLDDRYLSGYKQRAPVRAATIANIALSGTQTIDGIGVIVGNRVLVKNQTAGADNGIYVVGAGAWARSTDFDQAIPGEVEQGSQIFVEEGTTQAKTGWSLSTPSPITIGTTSLTFIQYAGANSYAAGTGLNLVGNTFSAQTTAALWNANQLQGVGVSNTAPSSSQFLRYNGSAWAAYSITKTDVGLANVDNTSDLNKPISTATQTALNGKEATISAGTTAQYWRGDKTWQTLNTSAVPEGTNMYWTNARGDARYPLLSGSYANPTWLASLPWSKITGAPPTFPTSSNLSDVLLNGNNANNTITLGSAGNTSAYPLNIMRRVSATDYTASVAASLTPGTDAAAQLTISDGTTNKFLAVRHADAAPTFSPDGGTNRYTLWHSNNHPAGSAFTPTLTGANVLSTLNVNSAGHITALTTRALTAGDISAVPEVPATGSWSGWLGINQGRFVSATTGAPSAGTWYGMHMPGDASNSAQIAFKNGSGYFRTYDAGVASSWLQLADRGWVTNNFAASSGSGNYIHASPAASQAATIDVSSSGSTGIMVRNTAAVSPSAGGFVRVLANGAPTAADQRLGGYIMGAYTSFANHFTGAQIEAKSSAAWTFGSSHPTYLSFYIGQSGTTNLNEVLRLANNQTTIASRTLMPTVSGIKGTGTGNANNAYFAFYESDGTTRQGYIGKASPSNSDIYITADVSDIELSAVGDINLNAVNGTVGLNNATKNHLVFLNAGVGAPTFGSRSVGTKIVFIPTIGPSTGDYGEGIETNHIWQSVSANNSTLGFKWYGGTTEIGRLSGTGQHSVNTSYTAPLITSPTATSLSVSSATGESILFNPAGTNRGTWDADGRLGIGVTPSSARASLLEVNGNVWSTDAYILGTTSSPTAEFGLAGGGTNGSVFVRTMGTGNLDLQTGASETRVQINGTTGNVGIGVINPSYKLQVNGSIRGTDIAATGSLAVTGDAHFANENVSINSLGQITTNGTLSVGGQITSSGGIEVAGGTLTIPTGAGANKVLTSDASGNASWANPTLPVATIQGNASLTSLPSTWNVVVLNHTANNALTISASYPGGFTGRVVQIINPTNFSFQISSTTYPAKSVTYVTWDNATTPAFTNVAQ